MVGASGFEPEASCAQGSCKKCILLVRLALFYVMVHGFGPNSAVVGPELDPTFFTQVGRRGLGSGSVSDDGAYPALVQVTSFDEGLISFSGVVVFAMHYPNRFQFEKPGNMFQCYPPAYWIAQRRNRQPVFFVVWGHGVNDCSRV